MEMHTTTRIRVPQEAVIKASGPVKKPSNRLSKAKGTVVVPDGSQIDPKKLDAKRVEKMLASGTLVQSGPPEPRPKGALVMKDDKTVERVKPAKKIRTAGGKAPGGKR